MVTNSSSNIKTGASGTVLQGKGVGTNSAFSTATYPATTTINQILYSSSANTIGGITAGDYGVLISSSAGVPSWLANGTTGQLLTATTSGTPSWTNAPASSITITGDVGTQTGATFNFRAGVDTPADAGGTANFSIASGQVNLNFTSATNTNTVLGSLGGTGGSDNTGLGSQALESTSGTQNCAIGQGALYQVTSGSYNTGLGYAAGEAYTGSESSNITISNVGVAAESNVIRIGTQGTGNGEQGTCYIAGIVGVTASNPEMVTINSSTGQMGVSTILYPGVASNAGTSAAPTGTSSTAAYVMMGLGSSWKLTPSKYTTVRITINGQMNNATTADGINIIMAYGTSGAPGNGAAVTGTAVGINTIFTDLTGLTSNGVPFAKNYIITGLVAGTAYWFDLQCKAVTGGTASVLNLEFTAEEMQY